MITTDDIIFLATICMCCVAAGVYRRMENNWPKRLYGSGLGLMVITLICGTQTFYPLLLIAGNLFIISVCNRKYIHDISLLWSWSYLIYLQFGVRLSSYAFGINQILALRLVGLASDMHTSDFLKNEGEDDDLEFSGNKFSMEYDVMEQDPEMADMVLYSVNFIGIHKGPYYRWKTYNDYFTTPYASLGECRFITEQKLKKVAMFMALYLWISGSYPLWAYESEEFYWRSGPVYRLLYNIPQLFRFVLASQIVGLMSAAVCSEAGFILYPSRSVPEPGAGPTVPGTVRHSLDGGHEAGPRTATSPSGHRGQTHASTPIGGQPSKKGGAAPPKDDDDVEAKPVEKKKSCFSCCKKNKKDPDPEAYTKSDGSPTPSTTKGGQKKGGSPTPTPKGGQTPSKGGSPTPSTTKGAQTPKKDGSPTPSTTKGAQTPKKESSPTPSTTKGAQAPQKEGAPTPSTAQGGETPANEAAPSPPLPKCCQPPKPKPPKKGSPTPSEKGAEAQPVDSKKSSPPPSGKGSPTPPSEKGSPPPPSAKGSPSPSSAKGSSPPPSAKGSSPPAKGAEAKPVGSKNASTPPAKGAEDPSEDPKKKKSSKKKKKDSYSEPAGADSNGEPDEGREGAQKESLEEEVAKDDYNFSTVKEFDNGSLVLGPTLRHTLRGWHMSVQYWFWAHIYRKIDHMGKLSRSAVSFLMWSLWYGVSCNQLILAPTIWVYLCIENHFEGVWREKLTGTEKERIACRTGFSLMRVLCLAYLAPCLVLRRSATYYYTSVFWVFHIAMLLLGGFVIATRNTEPEVDEEALLAEQEAAEVAAAEAEAAAAAQRKRRCC